MKAVMSDRVRRWLRNKESARELMRAVNMLHHNSGDPVEVYIGGVKYIIKEAIK